jgi:hypothetical protein
MAPVPIIRLGSTCTTACLFLMLVGGGKGSEIPADPQTDAHQPSAPSEPLVIQGRITTIQGTLVTVKTPNGYPGGLGIHAQIVIAGPTFKVDVSRARVLLPDGKQADTRPLAVGDRLLVVLNRPGPESPASGSPGSANQTYVASTIERIAYSDKIITH